MRTRELIEGSAGSEATAPCSHGTSDVDVWPSKHRMYGVPFFTETLEGVPGDKAMDIELAGERDDLDEVAEDAAADIDVTLE